MILELLRCLFRDFKPYQRINNFQKVDIFGDGKPGRGGILTSKPIEPTPAL